jgi:tetratricopeptide (TPR) repeat protein
MTEETQKKGLVSLSQAWFARLKGICHLTKKGSRKGLIDDIVKSSLLDNVAAGLPDDKSFAGAVPEDPSTQQIVAGDKDIYKKQEIATAAIPCPPSQASLPMKHVRWSLTPKILIGSVILIVLVLGLYSVLTKLSALPIVNTTASQQTKSAKPEPDKLLPSQQSEALLSEDHPRSLKVAQEYYLQGDYSHACAVYKQLLGNFPQNTEEDGTRDFLKLKMALCMEKTADNEESASLLKTVSKSRSPIVRVLANYHLCLLEMQKQQYLTARSRAYQAIAMLDAIGPEVNRMRNLRRNCYFLAAEAISRQALLLSDADKESPSKLWPRFDDQNEFLSDVDEQELRIVLNTGSQQLNQSLLGPIIEANSKDSNHSWLVNCNGAPIDEMMGRFSANAGYDVHWSVDAGKTGIRDRSVSLYLTVVTDRQCITVATGCAGLLATLDEGNIITIYNPVEYSYVSEQISLLCAEAVSCWQQFLFVYYEDPYLANVHFALGLLKAAQGRLAESLPEYKMVANRFMNSALAPDALMNSAKLKTSLQDYPGAYSDLKEAVEQYPDYEEIDRAYLSDRKSVV